MPSDGRVQAQTSFSGAGSSIDKRHFAISHRAIVVVFIFSHVRLFARESDRLSRPEDWSGEPFHSPGDLPHPGIEPRSPALQADSLPAEPPGNPNELTKQKETHRHREQTYGCQREGIVG